jgi:hypothetical protein
MLRKSHTTLGDAEGSWSWPPTLLPLARQRLTARRPWSLLAEGGHRGVVGAEGGLADL